MIILLGLQNLPSLNELSSLMENPEVRNIIQTLQQSQTSPNSQVSISDLLSNPQIRQSAEALVSSGNQNISTLLQNPQLMQMFVIFFNLSFSFFGIIILPYPIFNLLQDVTK
jgi:hypothetical protein